MKHSIFLGVSKLSPNYSNWLAKLYDGLNVIDFYSLADSEVAFHLHSVSGLLLTGGGDIDAGIYGQFEEVPYCKGIDQRRDRLEMMLIALAFKFNIPILGICRGLQILNVAMKGTLYPDISTFTGSTLVHQDNQDVDHSVMVDTGSLLFRITGTSHGMVNSSHHQAINKTGDCFLTSAFSNDGLIEAIETKTTTDQSFCLAVQWHPERMDINNPLSGLLGRGFIEAAMRRRGSDEVRR